MACLLFAALDFSVHMGTRATQSAQRELVEVFQQLALPRVPDLGAGATDVGHGQQVQSRQESLVAHPFCKGLDHVGVRQVFLLSHFGHGQVGVHQEFDQFGVFAGDAMVLAETAHFNGAQFRVVAPAALGHVVEKGADVEQPRLVPLGRQLGAEGVFVRMLRNEEAAHIAHDHQDVLVHGVNVEQVVLHLAHDAPEYPEVTPQHRGLVHQANDAGQALGGFQNLDESGSVDGVFAELAVHHASGVVQRAQCSGGQAFEGVVLFERQEGVEDGVGVAMVKIVADHFQETASIQEAFVDDAHGRVLRAMNTFFDVQDQDLVELGHRFGGPVISPHQHFTGAQAWGVGIAKGLGHRGLEVKHQAVFTAAGHLMQASANEFEHPFVALQLARLKRCQQAFVRQLGPVLSQVGGAGQPQHDLEIAQATGAFLAVGLQRIGRVFVFGMALAHFQQLGCEEVLGVHLLCRDAAQFGEPGFGAAQKTRFQQ